MLGGLAPSKTLTTVDRSEDEESVWPGPQLAQSRKPRKAREPPKDAHPTKSRKRKLGDRDFALDHIVLTKKIDQFTHQSTSEDAAQVLLRREKDMDAALKEMEAAATALTLVEQPSQVLMTPPAPCSDPSTRMDAMARWYCSVLRDNGPSVNHGKDETIKRLEQELANCRALRETEKAEYAAMKATCSELRAQKSKQDKELQHHVKRCQTLTERCNTFQDRDAKLSKKLRFWTRRAVGSTLWRLVSSTKSSALSSRVAELTRDVRSVTGKYQAVSEAKERSEASFSDSERANRLLEARILGLQALLTTQAEEAKSMAASREDALKGQRTLEAERFRLQREKEKLSSEKRNLELELGRASDDLSSEKGRHENTRTEMAKVVSERDEWRQKAASFETQSNLNHQEAVAQTDKKEELERTISTMRKAFEDQTAQLQASQGEANILKGQILAKETDLSAQSNKIEELGRKLQNTSNLHRQEARERAVAEGEANRTRLALERQATEAQGLYDALADKYSQSQTKLEACADSLEAKSNHLEELQQSLSRSEERVIAYDQRNVEDRDQATSEIKALLGVIPGDLRDTLRRVNVDPGAWCGTKTGSHRGCLVSGSSVLEGRPPMVVSQTNPVPPKSCSHPETSLAVDIRYKIIMATLYLSTPGERGYLQQLWGIWASLEGAEIQSDDMAALACSLISAANRVFRLFLDGTVDDLGFWITAQIVCSVRPWAFEEFDLSDILPPDHPGHQITRPLVCAGVSRILMSATGSQNEAADKSDGLFASLRTAAAISPDNCKHFATEMDRNPVNAVLYLLHDADADDAREVLIMLETTNGDCILWHDRAENCVVFQGQGFAMWLRLARADLGCPLEFPVPADLGVWTVERLTLVESSDRE